MRQGIRIRVFGVVKAGLPDDDAVFVLPPLLALKTPNEVVNGPVRSIVSRSSPEILVVPSVCSPPPSDTYFLR